MQGDDFDGCERGNRLQHLYETAKNPDLEVFSR